MVREIATILEGRMWVIESSKNPFLVEENLNQLQTIIKSEEPNPKRFDYLDLFLLTAFTVLISASIYVTPFSSLQEFF
jgi:hypothetical protein